MLLLDAPKPSRFIKHTIVEEIATECNGHYRRLQSHDMGYPVRIEAFADLDLEITIVRDHIDEPELTTVFAKCGPDSQAADRLKITINSSYEDLFHARPDLLRSTLGHEIGHYLLRHHQWRVTPGNAALLFPDMERQTRFLHDSSWKPLAFTKQDMNEWCRRAFKGDEDARKTLQQLQDRMEPEWMFWQAEHFSMCFLIPHDRLLWHLNRGCEVGSWFALARLADTFGVSPSMMRVRLSKMGAIIIENGSPKIGPMLKQPGMLR
jgi:hypothetical protein